MIAAVFFKSHPVPEQILPELHVTLRFSSDYLRSNTVIYIYEFIYPAPRKALFVDPFVGPSAFLPHLTRTHTCEHVR